LSNWVKIAYPGMEETPKLLDTMPDCHTPVGFLNINCKGEKIEKGLNNWDNWARWLLSGGIPPLQGL
jgi:hypothetical protein